MTIQELRDELAKYAEDLPILITWEGTFHSIQAKHIYPSADGVIILDADNNCYKQEIKSGQFRNSIVFTASL